MSERSLSWKGGWRGELRGMMALGWWKILMARRDRIKYSYKSILVNVFSKIKCTAVFRIINS